MELLYIWVDSFRKFKHTGFNFSDEFVFTADYRKDNEGEHVDLSVELKPNYLSLFPDDFVNITGIVGSNGAGKSTILQLLKLVCGDITKLAARIVFCYRKEFDSTIHTVFSDKGKHGPALLTTIKWKTENNHNTVLSNPTKYSFIPIKGAGFNETKITFEDSGETLEQVTGIFFSNTFEYNHEELFEDIINISTNSLLNKATKNFVDTINSEDIENGTFKKRSPHFQLFEDELKQQIEFIVFAKTNNINLPQLLPNTLGVLFEKSDYNYLRTTDRLRWNKAFLDEIDKKAFASFLNTSEPEKRLIDVTVLLSFYYSLKIDLFRSTNYDDIENVNRKLEKIAKSKNVIDDIKSFIISLTAISPRSRLDGLKKIVDGTLERELSRMSFTSNIDDPFRFEFSVNENLWKFLKIIFDLKYLDDPPFLEYRWNGLSSGQDAFLKQFARLYFIKDNVTKNTIWLLIDEGELYLHPQWQKDYLTHLINILPKIFLATKIQLFLCSHSPFVVSDLPRNNLILLSEEGKDISNTELEETFGSNIHMLFKNSFFLNGTLGTFAKGKIDDAIKYLNNEEQYSFKSLLDVQILINIIGEPLIRNQLQKMLNRKRLLAMENRIDGLEQRISDIEKRQN